MEEKKKQYSPEDIKQLTKFIELLLEIDMRENPDRYKKCLEHHEAPMLVHSVEECKKSREQLLSSNGSESDAGNKILTPPEINQSKKDQCRSDRQENYDKP